ncbi:MAG: dienelactone hydrolase family protein [Proteobacteria bacterium]|nr:dienelactone hydrolase family protein [Pseudomonadota bacterium]
MGATIELTASDGFKLAAYTAGSADAHAGIVVIQEIFGVNHHIRDMADRFAAKGYSVIAPAVYDRAERGVELGYTQADIDAGRTIRMKLDDAKLMLDVEAAAAHLGAKKKGIVGYCFGGTVAFWGATRSRSFAAASSWYGGGVAGTRTERANCPLQLHFGEKDASIPMTDVDAIRGAQPNAEIHVYMGAQHGFGCNERGSFSKPDYELAQERTLAFFAKHLA